ncbi:DUF3768 domain-containing protein [Amorphus coralli]|uniref:DUF3768 domain-containing protein n=1 Tax=Amorphus coralli TaxID=340680 RepID=UPI0003805E2B|nr:DUF3768 domain-containing protein [Amorphus coralli]
MAALSALEEGCGSGMPATLATLNDAFRRSFTGGRVMVTRGVAALPEAERAALLEAVREFDGFDESNDPYGEHDFGAIDCGANRYFWKIDAYDRSMKAASPDPLDPLQTWRVLTVMRADEY